MQPPSHVTRQFGRAVRDCRNARKMTQQESADACELDIGYVGQIGRGMRNPSLSVMHSIASVLKVSVSELVRNARPKIYWRVLSRN